MDLEANGRDMMCGYNKQQKYVGGNKTRRTTVCVLKRRKGIWIGNILRKSGLLAIVLEETVEEEKNIG